MSSAVGELVIRRLRRGARLAGCRLFRFRFRFSVGRTAALILPGNLSAKVCQRRVESSSEKWA